MQRIPALTIEDAPEASKPTLEQIKSKFGRIPNIFASAAHSPAALKGLMGLMGALSEGELDGLPHEAISLRIGERHGCRYCTAAHTAKAKMLGANENQAMDYRAGHADDPKLQALLGFAEKVMENRGQVTDEDVQRAKDAGLSDAELLETVGIVAVNTLTNYINALVKTDVDFPAAPKLE